jgi:hypothetical protein
MKIKAVYGVAQNFQTTITLRNEDMDVMAAEVGRFAAGLARGAKISLNYQDAGQSWQVSYDPKSKFYSHVYTGARFERSLSRAELELIADRWLDVSKYYSRT